jgi:predicted RNA methylase
MGTSRGDYNRPRKTSTVKGVFDMPYHFEMVSDGERVGCFHRAMEHTCKDKVVLEVGMGTGVLTWAALSGATKVYGVECDENVSFYAEQNLMKDPWRTRLELYPTDDIFDLLRDPECPIPWGDIDVVVAELMSTAMVHENQVPVMKALGEVLRPDCIRIPRSVVSLVEGVNADFLYGGVQIDSYFYEFTGIRKPRLLTESRAFDRVDFSAVDRDICETTIRLPALADSTVNALRFTSIVDLCPGVTFYSTDSLMPPVVLPLDEPVQVQRGGHIDVSLRFRYSTDWKVVTAFAEPA